MVLTYKYLDVEILPSDPSLFAMFVLHFKDSRVLLNPYLKLIL